MAKHRRADGDPPSILVLPTEKTKQLVKLGDTPYCDSCGVLIYDQSPSCEYLHRVAVL
ncbi:hypothetical protein SEA_AFLAC_62 [Gordonia phage Aflac]|nr:hypothetical protein SEA_AFLAC_62 [Gordonia phage Aflac]